MSEERPQSRSCPGHPVWSQGCLQDPREVGKFSGRVPSSRARGIQDKPYKLSVMTLAGMLHPRRVEVQGPAVQSHQKTHPTWDLRDKCYHAP